MIASLRGVVGGRSGSAVIIDVHGVGYLVQVGARTLAAIGDLGAEIALVVETQVRDDAIVLIGFPDTDERDLFRMLTSVQGVGTRIALAVLSVMTVPQTIAALASEDRAALARADGVGQRLAVRLVTELRDKATALSRALAVDVPVAGRLSADVEDTARSALLKLGFSRVEAAAYIGQALSSAAPPDGAAQLITACLRLAGQRSA